MEAEQSTKLEAECAFGKTCQADITFRWLKHLNGIMEQYNPQIFMEHEMGKAFVS